jgi:hypothetical protein
MYKITGIIIGLKDLTPAVYLEEVVSEHAAKGWEFYRVDTIGVVQYFGQTPEE